jgi:exosortase/archaeosortase family protein
MMTVTSSTPKYLVLYVTVFIVILLIFNVLPSEVVEAITAQTATWALTLFGHSATWEQSNGYTILTLVGEKTVTVSIIRECTALNVLGVMAGLILPLRASWLRRVISIGFAGLLLFALNIPRIAFTLYLTAYDTWPFTLIVERGLETYHYPISFAFGVIGVAVTVLAVSRWVTPELSETLLLIIDGVIGFVKKENTDPPPS